MAPANTINRRRFLQSTGTITAASLLRIGAPALLAIGQSACTAKQESSAFVALTDREAADFAAIAARIIPTTDTPGATEAGVIHFIDQAFAAEMSSQLGAARANLAEFNKALSAAHSGSEGFSALSDADQDLFLASVEDSDLFRLTWIMTIFGMFAMSKYGGNKDNIGWKLLNFEDGHGWQFPFGHYDAEVHGGDYLGTGHVGGNHGE